MTHIRVVGTNAAGPRVVHDGTVHQGIVPWVLLREVSDGLVIPCPDAGCDTETFYPASGGLDTETRWRVQHAFARLRRRRHGLTWAQARQDIQDRIALLPEGPAYFLLTATAEDDPDPPTGLRVVP